MSTLYKRSSLRPEGSRVKFTLHLSTRIQDKQLELPLINYMTDLAIEADSTGFAAISLTEHHLHENQGYQNSLLLAAALAPRLTQAALVLATVNPAIHHPLRFVESCNLIDQLNGGRLVVGFGSGFKETDLVAFGRDLSIRDRLFEDGVQTALDIWNYDASNGPLEFQVGTDRGRIEAPVNPSPFRKPHPILARGTMDEAAALETAARGWAVLTTAATPEVAQTRFARIHAVLDASGHDAETVQNAKAWSSVAKAIHVAETGEQALAEATAFFQKNPGGTIARSPDDMICGSVETAIRTMSAYAAAGVGHMICGMLIDVEDRSVLRRCLDLMQHEVIPRVTQQA
jgi:alkanesulfonate monooxygenase SsuD/methylene tetrahydromethanopterin reductase-like flavin-dependent oxidoreductase (luciferase family)